MANANKQSDDAYPSTERVASDYEPLKTFDLAKGDQKHYTQQFADMYYLRLALLKPDIKKIAAEAWDDFEASLGRARICHSWVNVME